MGTITTDLKEAFRRGNIYIQLIYINVAVFVVTTLTEVILQLFNRSLGGVFEWLELPASFTQFIIQPWSLFACRFSAYSVQHAMAILVWRIVPDVLLCKAFAGSLYIGRYLRRIAVYGGI